MASAAAYTVGRAELLGWLNSTLDLRLAKVEETANGAVACQLMDALYPGSVPMKRVDFNAKSEYDAINNYKVLQDVFNKLGVDKTVEVAKLIKGRPLDNTEFMQWFKAYWDSATGGQAIEEYDAAGRRAACKTGGLKGQGASAGAAAAAPRAAASTAAAAPGALPQRRAVSYAAKALTPPPAPAASRSKRGLISSGGASEGDALERLQEEVASWRTSAETATKEKDFYYSKLRAVELLCNTPGVAGSPLARAVEDILYAATQEEGEAGLAAAIAALEVRGEDEPSQPGGGEQQPQAQPEGEPEGEAPAEGDAEAQLPGAEVPVC